MATELREELATLRDIHRVRLAAVKAGPSQSADRGASQDAVQPTAVVTSRPRNIHRKAWVSMAVDRATAGRTPSWDGE